jgi:iron complex transport system substrate-binding protein
MMRSIFQNSNILVLAVLGLIFLGIVSCNGENTSVSSLQNPSLQTSTGENKPIQVIDGNDEAVSISFPAKRIVAEYIDNAELIRILGRQDKIVGVSGYDYIFEKCAMQFPKLSTLTSVGWFAQLDYETIFSLKPDLLLTFGSDTKTKKAKLPGIDILFLGLYYPDLSDPERSRFIRGVRNLGLILDSTEKAEDYIAWYLNLFNKIRSRTKDLLSRKKPTIFITSFPHAEIDTRTYSAYSMSDTLTQAALLAGGNIISETLPGFNKDVTGVKVDLEWLMVQDPDIIIMHAVDRIDLYGYETDNIAGLKNSLESMLGRPEMTGLKAVKNRQVYVFNGHFRNDASGGITAAAYMARLFHPDLFSDLNPEAIHQEYLSRQGLDYNLDEHGIFIFPPLMIDGTLMGIPNRYLKEAFNEG